MLHLTHTDRTQRQSLLLYLNKSILKTERMHDGGNSSELDVLIIDSQGTVFQLGRETNNTK